MASCAPVFTTEGPAELGGVERAKLDAKTLKAKNIVGLTRVYGTPARLAS